jgi:cyanophycin synthetase
VSLRLETPEEIEKAFWLAREFSAKVVIEEMCEGRDFRVLVINGKFSAASERTQPMVIGDGKSTIRELVDQVNQDPRRGVGHDAPLTRIEIDEISQQFLQKQNLHVNSIPAKNFPVILRSNANLSSGGTARDITDETHPDVRRLCERIARLVDLDICGIDIIAPSLSTPPTTQLKIIEVNAGPGLRMHLSPAIGEPRNVAGEIIETMFPVGSSSRIPIVAVTGTNGKTTVVRIIHKILSADAVVGMTTSDGISVGTSQILSGDMTGPQSARIVLSDPQVEKAVLEVARGGIRRRGLGYDWSDVGVITNIREDHIGQDGIESVEDLIWIKSLVAERVKENGTLVLNADDENSLLVRQSKRLKTRNHRILLYSCTAMNPEFRKHLLSGGDGAWAEAGWIYLQLQHKVHRLVSVHNLRFTMEGRAVFQVSNALAAVGAAAAVGATPDQISMGLMSFEPNADNLGRLNIYKVNEGHVILDYGHNPDAISAMGGFLSQWSGHRKIAVLGLPGDRADHLLRESAFRLMTSFDQVLIRDDEDLRGRVPREVPKIICKTIRSHDSDFSCEIKESERAAVEQALSQIQKEDIVVIFYENLESIMPILRQFDPTPVSDIPSADLREESIYDELRIPNSTYQVTR